MAKSRAERLKEKRRKNQLVAAANVQAVKVNKIENKAKTRLVWESMAQAISDKDKSVLSRKKQVEYEEDKAEILMNLLVLAFEGEISQGTLIKLLRRDVLGVNQDQFVELTGINRKTLSQVEGDRTKPTMKALVELIRPFGLEFAIVPRSKPMRDKVVDRLVKKRHSDD